jgi:hypothetical protein
VSDHRSKPPAPRRQGRQRLGRVPPHLLRPERVDPAANDNGILLKPWDTFTSEHGTPLYLSRFAYEDGELRYVMFRAAWPDRPGAEFGLTLGAVLGDLAAGRLTRRQRPEATAPPSLPAALARAMSGPPRRPYPRPRQPFRG